MLIVIDLTESRVLLQDPTDFTRFSVAIEGDGDLPEVIRESGLGRLKDDGEHVAVDPVALRALAGPAATDEWDEAFAGMREYASDKGWVEADGSIVAHIEPRDGAA